MKDSPTTVLVADDNADSRAIARALLELQGRGVLEAADGYECLRAARSERPDLILLDLVMPGMDGWTVAAALRTDPGTEHIPILALTATSRPEDHERALVAGCDAVLQKPISLSDITAGIDALLNPQQAPTRD